MKLQNLSVLFVIIILPIILVFSYYVSLQVDTINIQTSYNKKLIDSVKEAMEAFEINTVEWNNAYNSTGDVKRRNVMGSINVFKNSFANSLGIGGATSEEVLSYIPAMAFTLYDGYYIYSPAKTKKAITDDNGVQVVMTEKLVVAGGKINGYDYDANDKGKLLYELDENKGSRAGTYNGISFTFDETEAKDNDYSHILKPLTAYSATYVKDGIEVTINYTLDNYITVYGTVNCEPVKKSGYLINKNNEIKDVVTAESLSEMIWYEGLDIPLEYPYVYDYNKNKVYKDGNTLFRVSATNVRTNLSEGMSGTDYKKVLNGEEIALQELQGSDDMYDYSAQIYYKESLDFTEWIEENLASIQIKNMIRI